LHRHVSRSIARARNVGVHPYSFKSDTDKRNKSLDTCGLLGSYAA
jgi:hypothetical protein